MSRIVETKVRIGVEATGGEQARATIGNVVEGAKAAQQAFIGLQNEQAETYANIANTTPEIATQVQALSDSFAKLKGELGSLPDAIRMTVDGVLSSLQNGNIAGASAQTASSTYRRAPENVQAEVARIFENTYDLSKAGIAVEFGRLGPPPTNNPPATVGADDGGYNAARWRRLSGSYESRLDTLERQLDGAETDLNTLTPSKVREMRQLSGQIGSVGRQARGAAGAGQQDTLQSLDERYAGYGSRLDDLLRQRAERGFNDGVTEEQPEYSPNFAKLFERRLTDIGGRVGEVTPRTADDDLIKLERRLTRAAGDLEANRGGLSDDLYGSLRDRLGQQNGSLGELLRDRFEQNAGRLAHPMLERLTGLRGEVDALDPYTAKRSRLASLRSSVNSAQEDLAGFAGRLEPEVFDALNENLKDLTKKLDENVDAYNESGRGAAIRTPDGSGGMLDNLKGLLGDEAQRMFGAGMGQAGPFGRMAQTALTANPIGRAIATAAGAVKLHDTFVLNPAREAARTYTADVDLARQYGATYSDEPGGDPVDMFRDRRTGFSYDSLVRQGFTAADASRVMAQLDLVNGGRTDTAVQDTESILQMSRSTGLDEGRLTNTARTLGTMADFGRGEVGNGLELLKAAMTEGVAAGVSKADTLQALVGIVEEGFRDGHVMTERGLAFQAALVGNLAETGNRLFQGDNAGRVATGLVDFATGAGAPEMTMLLAPKIEELGGIDALNLNPDKPGDRELLDTLTTLEAQGATFARDELILSNVATKAPELLPDLTDYTLSMLAGNRDMEIQAIMRYSGLSLNEAAMVAGGDMGPLIAKSAAGLEPEDLTADTQGANATAANALEDAAIRTDTQQTKGYGFLEFIGDAVQNSRFMRGARKGFRAGLRADFLPENFEEVVSGQSAAMWLRRQFGEDSDDAPMPLPDATGTYTPPEVPPIQPDPQPPEAPDAATPRPGRNYAEGLFDLGSTSVTTYPGEVYGESLRGTPAEFLIGSKHRGADLRIGEAGRPDPIYSPWDRARVVDAGESDSYGHWLRLEAENGSKWELGHLNDPTGNLMGKTFRRGDKIATEGTSGASTGYHLDLRAYDTEDPALRAINKDPVQFWERFQNSLTAPDKTADAPEKKRLDVHIHGLNDIRVQGVGGQQAGAARAALNAFVAAITEPEGHRGFG